MNKPIEELITCTNQLNNTRIIEFKFPEVTEISELEVVTRVNRILGYTAISGIKFSRLSPWNYKIIIIPYAPKEYVNVLIIPNP